MKMRRQKCLLNPSFYMLLALSFTRLIFYSPYLLLALSVALFFYF